MEASINMETVSKSSVVHEAKIQRGFEDFALKRKTQLYLGGTKSSRSHSTHFFHSVNYTDYI